MIKKFTFVKENTGRWYVVLPEWTGDKEDLEMVMGADTMLDILSQGDSVVDVVLSTEPFDNHKFELMFINEESGGGWYKFYSEFNEMNIWLCSVTKFVFGELPKTIYGA
jgi:hypothetical protein